MTRLEHAVEIERPLADVYARARDVERYPEFLPGYLHSRILEWQNGSALLERKALVRGKVRQWQSWVQFTDGRAIDFEHAAGPLKGMRVHWLFTAMAPRRTHLAIVHELELRRPPIIGRWLEKWVYAPQVGEMAALVVRAFKIVCEEGGEG